MVKIKQIMSIGANCIAADIIKTLNLRKQGPVDNMNGVNICNSHMLFENKISDVFFKFPYKKRVSTSFERANYHFEDVIYNFEYGIEIVHNNFESKKFKKSLKKRIFSFNRYYKKSRRHESLWYMYSLNFNDEQLTEKDLQKIAKRLPDCCKNRLICIGMRVKNPLFEKYFKYYLECGEESEYKWNNRDCSERIFRKLEEKYGLQFDLKIKKEKEYNVCDCGVACFTKIASNFGIKTSVEEIFQNKDILTDYTSVKGIIDIAKYFMLKTFVLKGDCKSINETLPTPFIAFMYIELGKKFIDCFVVVESISRKKIRIWNPCVVHKKMIFDYEQFIKNWKGYAIFFDSIQRKNVLT